MRILKNLVTSRSQYSDMFKYEVDSVLSTHSFHSHQVSVVTISDKEENKYKGIAVFPVPEELYTEAIYYETAGCVGKPLVIGPETALSLCEFIDDVLLGRLQSKILVYSDKPKLKITLKNYTKKWHGEGGYKGKVEFGYNFFSFPNSIISKKSLSQLRTSLVNLYGLQT